MPDPRGKEDDERRHQEVFNRTVRDERNRARDATWAALGDKLVTLAASVLGLSVVFLTRIERLEYLEFLKASWIVFSIVLVSGLLRLSFDWRRHGLRGRIDEGHFVGRQWKFWRWTNFFNRGSHLLTAIGLVGFVVGLALLLTFAWINVDSFPTPDTLAAQPTPEV